MSVQLKILSLEVPSMIYNCHRPPLFDPFESKLCATRMLFGLYHQEETSSLQERWDKSGLDGLKEWWGTMWWQPLLVLCPATQCNQWVSCRWSMVMEWCCGFFASRPDGWIQNAIMLVAQHVAMKHIVLHFLKWQWLPSIICLCVGFEIIIT